MVKIEIDVTNDSVIDAVNDALDKGLLKIIDERIRRPTHAEFLLDELIDGSAFASAD